MSVIVGYIPTREGRAALRAARGEALLRKTKLIVVNSHRGGRDFDAEEAKRFEDELANVESALDEAGIAHSGVKDIGIASILEFRDPDGIALELIAAA